MGVLLGMLNYYRIFDYQIKCSLLFVSHSILGLSLRYLDLRTREVKCCWQAIATAPETQFVVYRGHRATPVPAAVGCT